MASRKRKNSTPNFFAGSHESNTSESTAQSSKARHQRQRKLRDTRRRQLLETLESRMLLAGPQLIGIQPNEGALIEDGTVRNTSPRVLTFGFDQDQVISEQSFEGIQISRAGADGQLGTNDDIAIEPGLITLGDPNQNEVVVRFAEALPDDEYRIEVFAFDDAGLGITGLRNANGELFMPSDPDARSEIVDFRLSLGALIESVVPQPVIRNSDGTLSQNRDEIVVYFNEDPLFVEDDDNGNPTERSAENPRFYQLLLTQETVRTTDDLRFHPETVVYDEATHTARLIFADDINELSGVPLEGGTWRLRIGTAVDDRVDLILPPTTVSVTPSAVTDFQHDGLRVVFASRTIGEAASGITVRFEDTGAGLLTARLDGDGNVVFDFGGSAPLVQDLIDVVGLTPAVDAILTISVELDGTIGAGADTAVPLSVIGAPPLSLQAAGDTLATSLDVGIFGQDDNITSVILTESIDPQAFDIELRGGNDDPGHRDLTGAARELERHINPDFGADTLNGVTEIAYNFQGIFDSVGNTSFLNQITESHKTRVREVLNLWSADLGVQFRETLDEGITFAVGDTSNLQSRGLSLIGPTTGPTAAISGTLGASIRIDPTFQQPAVVFSNQTDFALNYGEDFTRKATAAVGFVLGLESASDLPAQTTLALNGPFLNQSIDTPVGAVALEPVFPSNYDVIHGQHIHRPDSVDVDLYRFEVKLGDADRVGTVTAETFAERLPDSSLLDTTLALFEEVRATSVSDLGVGSSLGITFTSMFTGARGNNTEVRFIRTDRAFGDDEVRVNRVFSDAGTPLPNVVLLDLPRAGANIASVPAQDVVDAINDDPFASSIVRAEISIGDPLTDVSINDAPPQPVRLSGGGLTKLTQNDDYFSEDSRLIASLGEGVYYIGVSASGNDAYDPAIAESGFGGRTQGAYDLHIKFEPQVDEVDVIRDLDSPRPGVPGTRLDGDGDGTPGGAHNFWFQTRPLERVLNFTDNGEAITPGQTVTVESGTGIVRTYEFVPNGSQPIPGNVAVFYSDGSSGFPTPSGNLAAALAAAINTRQAESGVSVSRSGTTLQFSGDRSVDFSNNFRAATAIGRTLFVDKLAGPNADGSLARPFNSIANNDVANAFGSTLPGDIVRIVGNGGVDGDLSTEVDNFSYQIGISDVGGGSLADGRAMEVPQGVTTMIDAGAILKLRGSFIGIGSSTLQVDRSGGALQLLGTPRLVDLSLQGEPITTTLLADENAGPEGYSDGSVIVTSIRDRAAHAVSAGNSPDAAAGDWGGLIYRRDVDQFEGRRDLEDEGIFLQRVNHTEIRYGGSSNVLIDSQQQLVNPILIVNMRPTVTFNEITFSADSAISASPDSFEETSYQAPRFQQAGSFTADYDRVGPEISNNQLANNSVNGLFVRVPTTATQAPRELTVSGRFDDIDIVHVLPENLVVASQSGGSITDGFAPPMSLVTGRQLAGGTLDTGTYLYKMTFVDRDGFESLPSIDQFTIATTEDNSSVELAELPRVTPGGAYASRRLYRALDDGSANPVFQLIAELDASSTSFFDNGSSSDGLLDLGREGVRGRLDASLVLDPGIVLKLSGSRIELQPGSVVLAEGDASNPVVFTSLRDDRFGAGGTFDTNNDDGAPTVQPPAHGDWAGIYAGPTSSISIDQAVVSYAGGISLIEGGETRGFVPLQLQQAEGRITNTRFEFNDSGQDGAGPVGRFGRLSAAPSTIFVRGSQPIIVGNTFVDNDGSIIDIDVDSLDGDRRIDIGRQTGDIERFSELDDNYGPLIRFNRYEDNDLPGLNQITGLEIRGGTLTSESVWDDTDIVHLLFDSIIVDNFHSSGGLKLRSRPDESLVVKLTGAGTPNSDTIGTGLTATGTVNDSPGRLGGQITILGLPDAPVVLTSFRDDSVGAGLRPDGSPFTDNNGDKTNSRAEPNDWRSVYLAQNSTDRNVDVIPELELSTEAAPGLNGNIENAQLLGELAGSLTASDEVQRLGFEVEGFLSNPDDVDIYSFIGRPGTEVWIDIDKTTFGLDTVIELLDENGEVLARSDDSGDEIANGSVVDVFDPRLEGVTTSLQARDPQYSRFGAGGVFEDFDTANPRDAGIHFTLTGNDADPNARSSYFFRVRSASINPDDVSGGLSRGGYRFQVRLTEDQEFPGSVIRFSDIRFANHGIHVQGLLGTSPLLGEAGENEFYVENDGDRAAFQRDDANNDTLNTVTTVNNGFGLFGLESPQRRPQNLGNLTGNRSNVISVAGELRDAQDVDFYQIDVFNDDILNALRSTVFDVDYAAGFNRPDTNISVFYDPDGEFNDTEQPRLVLYGSDSNILDDLTSPNGENDDSEKLSRGSIATGDPLIGPVTLVEGTYYVAITADNVEPEVFVTDRFLRREPVNSVRRIVEERYDPLEGFSTASGPVVTEFFTPATLASGGFVQTGDFQPGHGRPAHFDGSFGTLPLNTVFNEFVIAPGDAADIFGGPFRATEVDSLDWSLTDNIEIGGDFFGGGFFSENTSTFLPHVSIDGQLGGDRVDFYEFTVSDQFSRVILDVDHGFNGNTLIDSDDPLTPFTFVDPTSVDTTMYLFREDVDINGVGLGTYQLVNTSLTSDTRDGRLGSDSLGGASTFDEDPFVDLFLQEGTYVVGVAQEQVAVTVDANGLPNVANTDPLFGPLDYRLHISVEDHPLPDNGGNQVIHFDRRTAVGPGTITSEPFDLSGYAAEDLPTFYFNSRFAPEFGDNVSARIFSDQDNTGRPLNSNFIADDVWQQSREDISDFAGQSGVRVEFTYTPSGVPVAIDDADITGLYLDDFIVGFAERGETIFNAPGDGTTFVGFGTGGSGEYQLEVRPGTEYSTAGTFAGSTPTTDFDTNDRHNQSITIVAPAGTQIFDGDTFVIGDGGTNRTFEFTTTPGSVEFGNTPVLFSATDTPAQVAESIRSAIAIQSSIDIEASSSGGEDTGALTDGRLALSGSARGSFLAIDTVADAPTNLTRDADGNLLLPAILHNGIGDSNFLRTQGQLIIDSNRISDVRAIGIWSEPGIRDIDPEDRRNFDDVFFNNFFVDFNDGIFFGGLDLIDGNHAFLEFPPVGNAYPGVARNLPTLNDSVEGGLTPGVVVTNNTIDNAGFAGVKVDGESAPFVLDIFDLTSEFVDEGSAFQGFPGDILEGSLLEIDAGGTRVTFEFDELNGNSTIAPLGSATIGSNGVADGHVPIYYREDPDESGYNRPNNALRIGYSSIELAISIMGAIQGSSLVTNGLVELVTATLGPSPYRRSRFNEQFQLTNSQYDTAAVYLQGVSNVRWIPGLASSGVDISQAPIAETAQPFARIVNNTIYGSDGRESAFPDANVESNDVIADAIDTKVGPSHRNVYTSTATLGDNDGPVAANGDVDFYQVNLGVGDRLIVDIDTEDIGGADTAVQIFNARGERQSFTQLSSGDIVTLSTEDTAPDYLDPLSTPTNVLADAANTRDPFIDFFAPEKGTYFVAVSGESNFGFEPDALSGRGGDDAELGLYTISLESFAPRTAVISADGGLPRNPGGRTADKGIRGADLIGTSFTVTQIPDFDPNAPAGARTNQVTYTFGQNIPLSANARLPDIMRAIADGINAEGSLLNNDSVNAPGPIAAARATALGGAAGDNPGINNLIRQGIENNPRIFFPHRDGIVNPATYEFNTQTAPGGDQLGFGHNQRGTSENGTTEQYVFLENIAKIELSPEAIAAGLTLDPVAGFDTDQIINETGILVGPGASPAILNNVLVNLHESVVVAESRAAGFGSASPNVQNKPQEVVVVGSVFHYDEGQPHFHQSKFSESVGLTTSTAVGPSNINGGTDDFNVITSDDADTLVNPAGDNFLPAPFSPAIDSNIDSLIERSEFANLKQSVGIPISNVLAPQRDVTNVLRADNPLFSNTGQGSSVFGDRGSEELADFVGPVAISEAPRDDDARGLDTDPNTSFINLTSGVYEEFRIQLRDAGDASDPFTGSGIDNNTVVVAEIPGVRRAGANVTLFEDERLLVEGIDYTFNFDETKHIITLTPLAGIWDNDRAYRIQLNNTDRTVVIAPSAATVSDGEQVTITDSNGGQVVFEFESGFQIQMPEPITLEVPTVGTNQGGLSDGGVFSINDGVNPVAVFEFDTDGTTVANPVALPTDPTPADEDELEVFLTTIANNIADAIQAVVDDPSQNLDVDVRVVGTSVVVGAEQGSRADVSTSGLVAAARTIGLQVPSSGAGIGGVAVGDSFQVNDGTNNEQFQFVDANTPTAPGAVPIDITPALGVGNEPLNAAEVATAIQAAIQQSALNLEPLIVGQVVYLNLPDTGLVNVPAGQLRPVSVSRVPNDGEQIVFTPNDSSDQVVFELNRTDERQADGSILDDGVDPNNIAIDLTRSTTGEELAGLVANAIRIPTIAGLSPNEISVVPGALLTVGGEAGLGLAVSGASLQVIGSPDVTGPSTLEIFGPLLLRVPFGTPDDGDFITVFDDVGAPINLEFDDDGVLNDPNAGRIGFTRFDDVDTLSLSVVGAINTSGAGITASYLGGGQISLGRIQSDRVDTTNSQLTTQRGVVSDGEVLTIRQGDLSVSYEFESVNNGGGIATGNVAVPFQPGSSTLEVANSLAAAITNNNGGLNLSASVNADGNVALQDLPGTLVDVTQAPTLILTGVPGGAIPVRISPAFSDAEVKQALLRAINSVNTGPAGEVTTLQAEDRGGATLFVENGLIYEGPVTTFFLPAIRDIQGQPLRANREDSTTQFTILMPTAGLDFGDAADPIGGVPGRYPTALENDGARHVVGTDLFLGSQVDADPSGLASVGADGDDSVTDVTSTGTLFSVAVVGGDASVNVQSELVDPATRDGDTVTIDTGITTATLEFDLDGRFDEDNFAIQPVDLTVESILAAMITALEESPVRPAGVNIVGTSLQISGDDEDGVSFSSPENPSGVLNPNTVLPITVSVTGGGVLQGWIDYDADGDWEDEEQILFFEPGADPNTATPRDEVIFSDIGGVQTFTLDTYFPDSSPDPLFVTNTTARFRVSRSGDLSPTGLALSGEVEDYQLLLVPGSPPTLTPEQSARTFTVDEDRVLQALDGSGILTVPTGDDGLLAGVVDPEGDAVAIFPDDTGVRQLFTNGGVFAGELNLSSDGTFTFSPALDFVGSVSFTARVTDLKPQDPSSQLVNADPINVTIDVLPVNDPPVATSIDVVVSRTIDEDQVILFTAEELIDPFYSPGPANEADQLLVFRSVSSPNGDDSLSLRGGTLEIQPDGRSVRYTPPADFNGADPDVFNFIVADVPGANQISEAAAKPGTVSLTINPVNDAPIVGNDSFNATEDQILRIPIRGVNGSIGILDNDTPGPQNEIDPPESQTIDLAPGQFPVQTPRGGRVDLEGDELVYRPPPLYSGPDNFTYRVVDNLGAESTGVVSLEVGGENNAPLFVGVNGDPNATSLTFEESKPNAQSDQFDLNTWFSDPENDVLQFTVASSNQAIVEAELDGSTLTLTRPAFAFGTVQLTVRATDPMGLFFEQNIPITINNDNDSPIVIGSLDPLSGTEDQTVVSELANVFRDPDGDSLTYVVARLGTILRPTAQQIVDHPLIQSISFVGDQMRIVPEPDQSGAVDIELEATDGSFLVNDFFTLTIDPVPDAPVSVEDGYNVAIGSTLRVLNPAEGLLRNDSDADGDTITVDLASVTQPQLGSLTVNNDGTFVYVNTSGTVGQTDTFQYRTIDSTTRTSELTTVTLELTRSQYQNPIQGEEADVTADGVVSPIDALRVINFLSRQANPGAVPVSEIGAPPPDFLDVNGDGFVSPADALAVINQLALNANGGGEGEQIASLSSTTAFAAASSDFLPTSNVFAVTSEPEGEQAVDSQLDTTDSLLTAGLMIDSVASDTATDQLVESVFDSSSESSIDNALTDWESELDSSLND